MAPPIVIVCEKVAIRFDRISNFVATQQRKSELFSAFTASKFGSFPDSYYICKRLLLINDALDLSHL